MCPDRIGVFTRQRAAGQAPPPTGRAHHVGGQLVRVRPACTTHTLPGQNMRGLTRRPAIDDTRQGCLIGRRGRGAALARHLCGRDRWPRDGRAIRLQQLKPQRLLTREELRGHTGEQRHSDTRRPSSPRGVACIVKEEARAFRAPRGFWKDICDLQLEIGPTHISASWTSGRNKQVVSRVFNSQLAVVIIGGLELDQRSRINANKCQKSRRAGQCKCVGICTDRIGGLCVCYRQHRREVCRRARIEHELCLGPKKTCTDTACGTRY